MVKLLFLLLSLFATLGLSAQDRAGRSLGLALGLYAPNQGVEDDDPTLTLGLNYWLRAGRLGFELGLDSLNFQGDIDIVEGVDTEIDIDNVLSAAVTVDLTRAFHLIGGVHWVDVSAKAPEEQLAITDSKFGIDLGAGYSFTYSLRLKAKLMLLPDAFEQDAVDAVTGIDDSDLRSLHVQFAYQF